MLTPPHDGEQGAIDTVFDGSDLADAASLSCLGGAKKGERRKEKGERSARAGQTDLV